MPDFLASLAVFGVITAVFLFSWNGIVESQTASPTESLRTEAKYTTTFLVSTSGYPTNWNYSNVEIPGFATQDNYLQSSKVFEFSRLNYQQQRRLFKTENFHLKFEKNNDIIYNGSNKVGNQPIAYIAGNESALNEKEYVEILNETDLRWDIYWPSNNGNFEDLSARNKYNYTENTGSMFEDLIENASNNQYSTVISSNIRQENAEIENSVTLEKYVLNGGSFVSIGNNEELIEDTFSLNSSDTQTSEGQIKNRYPILNKSFDKGDLVEFSSQMKTFSNPDYFYVEGSGDEGCLICRWNLGAGRLYYLSNTSLDDGSALISENQNEIFGNTYSYGIEPDNASTIIPIKRNIILNSSGGEKEVEMQYTVWRE